MPSPNTFSIKPISELLSRVISDGDTVVDPFARDSKLATYRNDLSPDTTAEFHMDAAHFGAFLLARDVIADVVLFDPPYSPGQMVEVYQSVGITGTKTSQNARLYKEARDGMDSILRPGGIAVSFGWNSAGFGKGRGYEMLEILLVAHGGAHNDTICVVERKL